MNIHDDAPIDHLAVEMACSGYHMHLRRNDQAEAVKRMYGKVTNPIIQQRIGAKTLRQVDRLVKELGLS